MPDDMCDVCTGTGKPASGKPCICGGTGSSIHEKVGLRRKVHELELQLHQARKDRDSLIEERYKIESEWQGRLLEATDIAKKALEDAKAMNRLVSQLQNGMFSIVGVLQGSMPDEKSFHAVYEIAKGFVDQKPTCCGESMVFENSDFRSHNWRCLKCGKTGKCDHTCCGGSRR